MNLYLIQVYSQITLYRLKFRYTYLALIPMAVSGFHMWIPAPVSKDSLYLLVYLSTLLGSELSCVLSHVMDTRKVIDFSVCSLLSFLLEYSADFQDFKWENRKQTEQFSF